MGLGLRESRYYDRRRRRTRVFRWLFVLIAIAALGAVSYQSGSELAKREVRQLEAQVANLTREVDALRAKSTQLAGDAGAARLRVQDLRRRYNAEVPTGKSRDLLDLVEKKLAAGVGPDRIAFMIEAATEKPECAGKPVTKRFLVRTPISRGANDSVGFADGTITVTARGDSATNENGNIEAWFDPGKPVTVLFTALGGKGMEVSGMLPIHRSVIHNGDEYRFSVVDGEQRGFVTVTSDRCEFPK